ncbi:hypothetical protein CCH79_00019918 [Gambusia affinis]|uniref:MyoD family inhibitor domain-containing protein n=1 Tax=Gambusia affinis TaxID=33528 RepID=A0A315V9A8_GAMAF|nr:hypothetical protein CCH79_00019918 [Gambusia affinis]
MDATSLCSVSGGTEGGASKHPNQSESVSEQPVANGKLPHHCTGEAPPPASDRLQEADSSDESLTDSFSTKDVSRLLPASHRQRGVVSSSEAPIGCPPPPTCSPATSGRRLPSTKSHASLKTDAAHIKEFKFASRLMSMFPVSGRVLVGRRDKLTQEVITEKMKEKLQMRPNVKHFCLHKYCCVHCLLACLFCELLSMCSALGECLTCGVGGASCCDGAACCCCVEAAGEAACQAVLDCGMLENCCASSDCLEVCLECCAIVFPS